MHEYHLVDQLVKEALKAAEDKKLNKVSKVYFVVGRSRGMEEGAVKLYFETISEGTILQGAEVFIRFIPTQLNCLKCRKNFLPSKASLNCPACGVQGQPTETGKELSVEKVE